MSVSVEKRIFSQTQAAMNLRGDWGLFLLSLRANEVCYFWDQEAVLWETGVKFMGMQIQGSSGSNRLWDSSGIGEAQTWPIALLRRLADSVELNESGVWEQAC